MMSAVAVVYGGASVCAFAAYGIDKAAAKMGWRRIPELYLHLIALACGWPGALLGQRVFRHKCSKRAFLKVFWALSAVNAACCVGFVWITNV